MSAPDAEWFVESWQLHDGLPNNDVVGLTRTADDFLWVATRDSLARFDGVVFESYPSTAFMAGEKRGERAMLTSRDGGLWLALNPGVFVKLKDGIAQVIDRGVPELVVERIVEDRDGALWISYHGGDVGRLQGDRVTLFSEAQGLPVGYSRCSLTVATDGRVWFAKKGEVGFFDGERFRRLFSIESNEPTLAPAAEGGIWLCTETALAWIGPDRVPQRRIVFANAIRPSSIVEDAGGAVWIGTQDSGLWRYQTGRLESVPTSSRRIQTLMTDGADRLWVGTWGGGLNRVKPRPIRVEAAERGLAEDGTVHSMCEDSRGVLWAVTPGGALLYRSGDKWIEVSNRADWPGGEAACVAPDGGDGLWIGTRSRAVYHRVHDRYVIFGATDGIESRWTNVVYRSRRGDVWFGLEKPDALFRLRGERLERMPLPDDIRGIRAMAEDAVGDIWVAAGRGGGGRTLLRLSGDHVFVETGQLGTGAKTLRTLHSGPDHTIWMGCSGGALGRIKEGRLTWIGGNRGLYDAVISQIVADDHGWIWFGADHGLFKVRQRELDAVADGRAQSVSSVVYAEDGLRNLQGNTGGGLGALRSRDGHLWIPTRSGLVTIDPTRLDESGRPLVPVICRAAVNQRRVAAYGGVVPVAPLLDLRLRDVKLDLEPTFDRLEFSFTALGASAPDQVRFRYRLDNFDDGWVEAGTQRTASYSRLEYGDYRFRVQACSADGVWRDNGASVGITVTPFVWQTWPFRIAALGLLTASTSVVVRYLSLRRMRRKLEWLQHQDALHRERARIARDLHDNLGSSLTKIILLNDLTLDYCAGTEKATRNAVEVSNAAREVIKSLDGTVWALNPQNDTLSNLLDYMGQFAVEFLQATPTRCRLSLPRSVPMHAVAADVRHNVLMFVKEALTNVVRHAAATEVWLRADISDRGLHLAVHDNGRGFILGNAVTGADGLRNMRHRVEEIGGTFTIESAPGAGTRITVTISWRAAAAGGRSITTSS